MNKDQIKGRIAEAKGKAQEVAGNITGNKEMEKNGKFRKMVGKTRAIIGDLKDEIKKS